MTRANSLADLRKRSTGEWTVVDDGRPAIAPAELDAAAVALENAGALGVDVPNPLAAKLTAQSIVLPIPPSANDYWSWSEVGVYVTKAARLYKKNVKELVQYSRLQPFTGDIAIYLHVYRPAQRGDLDNYNKVLLDALKGLAFEDDSQVIELHSWRHDDKRNPRVEVEVRKIPN